MPSCLDCRTSSRGICGVHAATDNQSDDVDVELARLREQNRRLRITVEELYRLAFPSGPKLDQTGDS
jgi:hypothetical protein